MAHQFGTLSNRGRVYVLAVSASGLAIAAHSVGQLFVQQVDLQWLVLAALTLLTGNFTVRIPGITARLSVSDTFIFASVLLFGPAAGTITVLLDALIISLRLGPQDREPFRVIFNVSVGALSTWIAAQVFFLVADIPPYSVQQTPLGQILFPLFLFTLSYFLLNSWLVTFAIALEGTKSPYRIWRDNFLWLSVNYFGGASVAGLLVTYTREIDLTTLGIIVPLLLISYLTFKTSLGRIEDANRHLMEVNTMYLSTIETLAMAIDAKDQITHGHIRRVQRFAVGLAKAVGVNDDTQIRAIEAAALLHDMGKLAIPEFILNKPGRLTSNEFDVMKQHANIGADILSSIQFPYPVVPIVRHHHEAWDGSGYPDGIKGVSIPLGARVLSVVDCFDALTSDRPYRPKLPVSEAIAILVQRRGSMYDPMVVDRFIEVQQQLSEPPATADDAKKAIDSIATKLRVVPESPIPAPREIGESLPVTVLSLLRSLHPSPMGTSVEDLGSIVSKQLVRLTKSSSLAFYCTEPHGHSIRCRYADGPLESLTNGSEIALGERLSGWVAAHRTPIWNSDAKLDLSSDISEDSGIALGSSVPLIDGTRLVGVLTLYSPSGAEIALEQRMLIQSMAPLLATALSSALAHDQLAVYDASDTVAKETLYSVLDAIFSHSSNRPDKSPSEAVSIALITIRPSVQNKEYSHEAVQASVQAELVSATNGAGHVVRLSASEMLVIAPARTLIGAGLEQAPPRGSGSDYRRRDYRIRDITNSLELREVLGLTVPPEPQGSGKPLIH